MKWLQQLPPALKEELGARILAKIAENAVGLGKLQARIGRHTARDLIGSGLVSLSDVRMMLRGQILLLDGESPVCTMEEEFGEAPRLVRQLRVLPPDRPTKAARNDLQCPLQERYERGELLYIPCGRLLWAYGDEDTPADWPEPSSEQEQIQQDIARMYLEDQNSAACQRLGVVANEVYGKLSGDARVPSRPTSDYIAPSDHPAPPPLIEWGQALVQHPPDSPMTGELAAERLRFLLGTKRMYEQDLGHMFHNQVVVTDRRWLPCRDDPRRNEFVDREGPDPWPTRHCSQELCPLQVRGKQGDRTVPCYEALREKPDPSLISVKQRLRKRGLFPGGPKEAPLVDELGQPLPVSWRGEADQPGGPEDPVRLLRMRPCYLLGRVLYDGLPLRLVELLIEPDDEPAEQGEAASAADELSVIQIGFLVARFSSEGRGIWSTAEQAP